MNGSNLLQGIGLLVCVGAIILVALVAFAARAMSRRNTTTQNPNMWNTQGPEQPHYNAPDVESQGGFGSVPNTGNRGEVGRGDMIGSSGFGGGANSYDQENRPSSNRPNRENDNDQISSSGGFGGR